MRVISGSKKGYKLKAPKGRDIRPTEDRIKESLFNILGDVDKNSIVLDLYAGSGSIGIEFLSRGAQKAYFIDNSIMSIKVINENLAHTGLEDKANVIKANAQKGINLLSKNNLSFDYIFMDPPYRQNLCIKILKYIYKKDILKKEGIIIIEHEKELILDDKIYGFTNIDHRNYGNKSLTFYINN
ncbi:16S rRNA (guanine(966)-N(2))-methyltransferase RsmD [Keratinibaculum paraultunense]|uniref:16S rRNA (Guanine(966)-N(2))-methyltransferase RsmD n=1 Tax=Keratinibaculum paraultunense TaxID=1278232 RepID=A0A4R3KWU4_9FIRM|nr:16S rRNA (guanine(966)-N(2))-methyltransferase RsmD [Keratinibaculum paraultunense]QQY80772.1 16S rRNA (guanine(966)-N(2))-methyltransferase RsmD [Keratinibaculum paraultunense]TCS89616.1 16S rRNA (guanine(966)-N(2))-methyltransferase RsmD [Keratinibaculum paraultunense]